MPLLAEFRALDRRVWVLAAARLVVTAGFAMVMPFLAMHLAIDHYRARARRPEVALEPDALDLQAGPQAALSAPELAVAAAQRHRMLLAAIEQLPPVCRDAFILTKLYAMTQDEAAARLGVSRGMVARHLARALQSLQPVLFDGVGCA